MELFWHLTGCFWVLFLKNRTLQCYLICAGKVKKCFFGGGGCRMVALSFLYKASVTSEGDGSGFNWRRYTLRISERDGSVFLWGDIIMSFSTDRGKPPTSNSLKHLILITDTKESFYCFFAIVGVAESTPFKRKRTVECWRGWHVSRWVRNFNHFLNKTH